MSEFTAVPVEKEVVPFDDGSAYSRKKAREKREEDEYKALMAQYKNRGKNPDEENTDEQETAQENVVQEAEDKETKNSEKENKPLSKDELASEERYEKRYGDLRRHSQKVQDDLKAEIESLKEQLAGNGTVLPPKSDEDIAAWATKYPDIAAIVETIAEKKASEKYNLTADKLSKLEEQRMDIERDKAISAIKKVHKDFDSLKESDDFHNWADDQPKWIQDALYNNPDDAKSVIRVIDLYKVDAGLTPADQRRKVREDAQDVGRPNSKPDLNEHEKPRFSESQIKKNSDDWFAKNYNNILEAQREGRFDYDLSGGAR